MKKRLLLVVAALVVCTAAVSVSRAQEEYSPQTVSRLLIQKLESQRKNPGALEKAEQCLLAGDRYILPFSGGELQLFAYADEDAAARDLLNVSEDGSRVGETDAEWSAAAHFYLRDNVIVLYVGENSAVLRLLESLCGPQIRGADVQL